MYVLSFGWDNAGNSPVYDPSVCAAGDQTNPFTVFLLVTVLLTQHYVVYLWCVQCFSQEKLVRFNSATGRFSISLQRCTSKPLSHSSALPREAVSYFDAHFSCNARRGDKRFSRGIQFIKMKQGYKWHKRSWQLNNKQHWFCSLIGIVFLQSTATPTYSQQEWCWL